jgi:tRNA threonylcarbamoyladenosine biosynthesis protein TsaB
MTVILAADTSTSLNTVALSREGVLLSEATVNCQRLHAERLISTVDWLLRESGLRLDEVDLFAIAHGPGSFTGLRIGISTWKGFAFGLRKPLIGVSTLDALARQLCTGTGLVCPLLDARMKEVYGALYRCTPEGPQRLMEERVDTAESFAQQVTAQAPAGVLFAGDGAELYRTLLLQLVPGASVLDPLLGHPRAAAVAAEAYRLLQQGAPAVGALVNPVYLRQSQAEQNRARQHNGAVRSS